MSNAAKAYYQERAHRLSVPLPSVLDGNVYKHLPDNPDQPYDKDYIASTGVWLGRLLSEAEPFIAAGMRSQVVRHALGWHHPAPDKLATPSTTTRRYARDLPHALADKALGPLLGPQRCRNFSLEALARSEVTDFMINGATPKGPSGNHQARRPELEDGQVYFMVNNIVERAGGASSYRIQRFVLGTLLRRKEGVIQLYLPAW